MKNAIAMGMLWAAATACGELEYKMPDAPPPPIDAPADTCNPMAWYADCDGDGVAAMTSETMMSCVMPAAPGCGGGWVTTQPVAGADDCNDARADVKPGANDICDGADNNCNGSIDENGLTTFYQDLDHDTYGNSSASMDTCNAPSDYVPTGGDCNDGNANIHPNATETCDQLDNNCNGSSDEALATQTYYLDGDSDTYGNSASAIVRCNAPSGYVATGGDCNDANAAIRPNATEACNGIDDNCAGGADDGLTFSYYYLDSDNDGYGNAFTTQYACAQPSGYATNFSDCDDGNFAIKPGATEVCYNGADDNCAGGQDEPCTIACDWAPGGTGIAHWLSHGYDGVHAFDVGVWASCQNGKITNMQKVAPPAGVGWCSVNNRQCSSSNPCGFGEGNCNAQEGFTSIYQPTGTADTLVGCNWAGASRFVSQGDDRAGFQFLYGANVACDSTSRVTSINYGGASHINDPAGAVFTSGVNGCNWTGAWYLTYGKNENEGGLCAWNAGIVVTCSNSRITNIEFKNNGCYP
jgi:hypothetical protein